VVNLTVAQKVRSAEPIPFFGSMAPEGEQLREGQGSGFLISADGYVLTNNHVVARAQQVQVRLSDGREVEGKVVGTDDRIDVALVKIDAGKDLPHVQMGSSDALKVGDWVVAIGNPFGLDHTVTAGIVSAKGRVLGAGPYDDFIQTDASINPGNSGGPLFNLAGEVVGINTAVSRMGQGIGFAVPIDMVKGVVDELRTHGKVARGWIGVGLQELNPELAERLDLEVEQGVLLSQVYPNTPAAQAGLKAGDLLVSVGGKEVKDSETVVRTIGMHRPGEILALRYHRNGKVQEARVTLGERPEEEALAQGKTGRPPEKSAPVEERGPVAQLGLGVKAPEKGSQGVMITRVEEGSPANGLLKAGDLILECNRLPVGNATELASALKRNSKGAVFVVERKGGQVLVDVPLQ
jgi:serine protease Do